MKGVSGVDEVGWIVPPAGLSPEKNTHGHTFKSAVAGLAEALSAELALLLEGDAGQEAIEKCREVRGGLLALHWGHAGPDSWETGFP